MNILAYADDIVLIGKNQRKIRQLFVEMQNFVRKLGLQINKKKIYESGKEKHFKTKSNRTLENKKLQIGES
jgi:1,2-phenylacetyl-CoA epoxidase catalytic subunit